MVCSLTDKIFLDTFYKLNEFSLRAYATSKKITWQWIDWKDTTKIFRICIWEWKLVETKRKEDQNSSSLEGKKCVHSIPQDSVTLLLTSEIGASFPWSGETASPGKNDVMSHTIYNVYEDSVKCITFQSERVVILLQINIWCVFQSRRKHYINFAIVALYGDRGRD